MCCARRTCTVQHSRVRSRPTLLLVVLVHCCALQLLGLDVSRGEIGQMLAEVDEDGSGECEGSGGLGVSLVAMLAVGPKAGSGGFRGSSRLQPVLIVAAAPGGCGSMWAAW